MELTVNEKAYPVYIGIPTRKFTEDDLVSIDTEFFDMVDGKLHRPTGKFASMQICDGESVWMILSELEVPKALEVISPAFWVFHNAAFDVFHLRRYADVPDRRLWDTMLFEQVKYSGYYGSFSLQALVRRYFSIYIDKTARKEFSKAEEMSNEAFVYSALDAVWTWLVADKQMETASKLEKSLLYNIEVPAMFAILQCGGMPVDKTAWLEYLKEVKVTADSLRKELGINPNSHTQVKEYLASLGIIVRNTNEQDGLFEVRNHPIVAKILEYRGAAKLVSTYGRKFLDSNVEGDGKIYSGYNLMGAKTGRMSSDNPNIQNIPRGVLRSFFKAPDGYVFVSSDFSQQEIIIAADISNDHILLEAIADGQDIYLFMASLVANEKVSDKKDPRRQSAKGLALGAIYGLSKVGFAKKEGISEKDAKRLLDAFFKSFYGLDRYVKGQKALVDRQDFVTTASGRKLYVNPYNSQKYRSCLNSPIQGTAAEITKVALKLVYRRWFEHDILCHYPFGLASVVHDEINFLVPEEIAEATKELLERCMIDAGKPFLKRATLRVEAKIGKTWLEVH